MCAIFTPGARGFRQFEQLKVEGLPGGGPLARKTRDIARGTEPLQQGVVVAVAFAAKRRTPSLGKQGLGAYVWRQNRRG